MSVGIRLAAAAIVAAAGVSACPAHAALIAAGNTIQTSFAVGPTQENENLFTFGSNAPVSLASPVNYKQGTLSGSVINVGGTAGSPTDQITITNILQNVSFCSDGTSVGSACTDAFTGFTFLFGAGMNISNVTVNPGSGSAFLPATFGSHTGLTFTATSITVDLTGDLPPASPAPNPADNLPLTTITAGSQLILDITFGTGNNGGNTGGTTSAPEPASLALFASGATGLIAARRQRRKCT